MTGDSYRLKHRKPTCLISELTSTFSGQFCPFLLTAPQEILLNSLYVFLFKKYTYIVTVDFGGLGLPRHKNEAADNTLSTA
jgi:hypothetical protein